MNEFDKRVNTYFIAAGDLSVFALSHVLAYLLRFEFSLDAAQVFSIVQLLPFLLIFKLVTFWSFGLYRGMYRYFSFEDLMSLLKASVFSALCIHFFLIVMSRFEGYSRAVFIMDGGFTFLLCAVLRIAVRMAHHGYLRPFGAARFLLGPKETDGVRTLIVGAGDTGEKTLRELTGNRKLKLKVVGFIDDDPRKQRLTIHNVPVLGAIAELAAIIRQYLIVEVLIAMPSASGSQIRKVVEVSEAAGVRFRILPALGELIDGKVSLKALRDVSFEDLLGRPPIKVDAANIEGYIKNRCVLITGAGGSIGAELCRQIVRFDPSLLVLFDAAEANLYSIQMELQHRLNFNRYTTVLGSVTNAPLVNRVLRKYRPATLFHAAAYKHVPMLQRNPWEAVLNNISGTQNILEACVQNEVGTFVLVSTDKAVRPTSIMGASKRVCELLMHNYREQCCRLMGVRFGNVVGSSGSVIPLFRRQIAAGGPVTVTHPEITRYFMTIPEAAQLILQAGGLGQGGEIFVLEMGTAVRIADLARDLIRLSGKEPGQDIEIVYSGLRPGEKLFEELITLDEGIQPTPHEKIMVLRPSGQPPGFDEAALYKHWLMERVEALYQCAKEQDTAGIVTLLQEIVPEYTPKDTDLCVLGSGDVGQAEHACPAVMGIGQ